MFFISKVTAILLLCGSERAKMRVLVVLIFLMASMHGWGKDKRSSYIGMDVYQLMYNTVSINYSNEIKPFVTAVLEVGYRYNFDMNPQLNETPDEFVELSICPCLNQGLSAIRQTGGFINFGGYINFRERYGQRNFGRFGMFYNNIVLYELTRCWCLDEYKDVAWVKDEDQLRYISGISIIGGYEFMILPRLRADVELKISFPTMNYRSLNEFDKVLPGMGPEAYFGGVFPTLVVNFKYRLND